MQTLKEILYIILFIIFLPILLVIGLIDIIVIVIQDKISEKKFTPTESEKNCPDFIDVDYDY